MQIVQMKLKWIIEFFCSHANKSQAKKMIEPLLDIASQTKNSKNAFKNIGHLRVMLKHCEVKDIQPYLSETIFTTIASK